MTDIVVHRCVLRIRRTAGWAWSESPDALLAAATRALPSLIAARLPTAAARAHGDVRIAAPVRVRMTATLAELAALASGAPLGEAQARLAERLGEAVERAIGAALATAADTAIETVEDATPVEASASEPEAAADPSTAMRRAVLAWHRTGAIASVLARCDARAILALHAGVLGEQRGAAAPGELVAIAARALELAAPAAPAGPIDVLRARLMAAAAVIATRETIERAVLRAVIDRVVEAPEAAALDAAAGHDEARRESSVPVTRVAAAGEPGVAANPAPAPSQPHRRTARTARELEIRTVLPFLLLPSLHHAGWLATLDALVAAHELQDAAFAIAAGLAGKVLDPPDRGWARTRDERAVIAAFAGAGEPIADAEIAAATARLAPVLAALDDALRGALARARGSHVPSLLWRGARGWFVIDADGFAVLATGPDPARLLAHACSPVIVPAAFAEPALLDRIDLANLRFVTDAPPTRREPWRAVGRMWTNDTATPAARLAAQVADLDDVIAHAAELVEAIEARPAIPRDVPQALETTCTLAATAAFADLAARLFPAERATPMLGLTRFRDLDAHVRVEPDVVRVRVPLGRRHADLMRHGFLTTIPPVPWLGGRAVDLGGA